MVPTFSTLLHALKENGSNGDLPALILCGASSPPVTRSALHKAICDTAGRLKECGIKPGATISLAFENSVRAALCLGADVTVSSWAALHGCKLYNAPMANVHKPCQ